MSVFQCGFVSDVGTRCQMKRWHVDSTDPSIRPHQAWDENGLESMIIPLEEEQNSGSAE